MALRILLALSVCLCAAPIAPAQPSQAIPNQLNFVAAVGAGDPAIQTFQIIPNPNALNQGWQAGVTTNTGGNWLAIDQLQGVGNATVRVGAFVTAAGLAAGTYYGTITVKVAGEPAFFISVILEVAGTPVIFIAPVNFPKPPAQTLQVSVANNGSVAASWTASISVISGGNWLSVSPTSGAASATMTLTADGTGLAIGQYLSYVRIAGASPSLTLVALQVTAAIAAGPPVSMTKLVGDFQAGIVGGPLPNPLAVKLWTGPNGTGDPSVPTDVTFALTAGTGTFSNGKTSIVITTIQGIAFTTMTLGTKPQISTVTATATTAKGPISQTFTVGALAGPVTDVDIVATPITPVIPGATVFAGVKAHDKYGNIVAGYKLTFAVGSGGGSLTGTAAATDNSGVAGTSWIIGTGVNTLTVSGTGITTKTFTVTAVPIQPKPTVLPAQLTFTAVEGGPTPLPQSFAVHTPPIPNVNFTVTPVAADKWLTVSVPKGASPQLITVSIAPGQAAGDYMSTINVSNGFGTVTVPVTLTVAAAGAPALDVPSTQLTVTAPVPSAVKQSQTVRVSNTGGGTLTFTTSIATSGGGLWLSASPSSGTAPQDVTLTADFAGQFAGSRSALVTFTGSDGSTRYVQVNMVAAANGLIVDRPALALTPGASGNVNVSSAIGAQQVSYNIVPPVAWATVTASATSTPTALAVSALPVPGSTGVLQAVLEVFTPNSNPPNMIEIPLTLTLGGPAKTPVFFSTEGISGLFVRNGTFTGGILTTTPADPSAIVFPISIPPGITYTYDKTTRIPAVTVDTKAAVNGSCLQLGGMQDNDPAIYPYQYCVVGTQLGSSTTPVLVVNAPLFNFGATQGVARAVQAVLFDVNGNPITGAQVTMTPGNGDAIVALKDIGGGLYSGAWMPLVAGPVSVTFSAPGTSAPPVVLSGNIDTAPSTLRYIPRGAAVNAASFAPGGPLIPGSLSTVFGVNLAASTGAASTVPLPTQLAGVTLSLNGISAPLIFVGAGQVNFQTPFEIATQGMAQMEISNGTSTVSLSDIPVGAQSPGIFLASAAQGAIVHASGKLADANSPAFQGETVLIYATGVGPVTNPPPTGGLAGLPFSDMITKPTVTIGGKSADVTFAGLAPGYAGLYQLNVTVPFGLSSGANPVVIQSGLALSNTATIAVK